MNVADIASLSKADLHIHLSGAIPTDTIRQLVRDNAIDIPPDFDLSTDLQVIRPIAALEEYFLPWKVLKMLPIGRSCLRRMIRDTIAGLAAQGVRYVELRHTVKPVWLNAAISKDEALIWLTEEIDRASQEYDVTAKLIVTLSRHDFNTKSAHTLLAAIKATNHRGIIVGLDLAGHETLALPIDAPDVFLRAKGELSLGITIHAGEVNCADNVRWAVEDCKADRIGHATAAANDIRLMELLVDNDVCVEICLTSNLLLGSITHVRQHPVGIMEEMGVPWVLCSDNPSINNSTLNSEYLKYANSFPASLALESMYETQMRYAFAGTKK